MFEILVVSGPNEVALGSKEKLLEAMLCLFNGCKKVAFETDLTGCITKISYSESVDLKQWLGTHRFVRYEDINGRKLRTTSFVCVTDSIETAFNGEPFRTWEE